MASLLQARAHPAGQWLIRIEDIDHTRIQVGMAEQHIAQLAQLGMVSDAPVLVQSQHQARYQSALDQLLSKGVVYACRCSRQDILRSGASTYSGKCRTLGLPHTGNALRLNLASQLAQEKLPSCESFDDLLVGRFWQNMADEVGDFVLRRADGAFSYQLTVVVDDAFQKVTQVVRGADLLDNTPRQRLLQALLELPEVSYVHIPLVLAADNEKLSKQNGAQALVTGTESQRVSTLIQAAQHLELNAPEVLRATTVAQFWTAARQTWRYAA
jgi:glutamyl-Q tRNA(Asp) synthetase